LKEGHILEVKNPSCHGQNNEQCQEGQTYPLQLFNLESFLGKISYCTRVEGNR
jgi:hypothetical protein